MAVVKMHLTASEKIISYIYLNLSIPPSTLPFLFFILFLSFLLPPPEISTPFFLPLFSSPPISFFLSLPFPSLPGFPSLPSPPPPCLSPPSLPSLCLVPSPSTLPSPCLFIHPSLSLLFPLSYTPVFSPVSPSYFSTLFSFIPSSSLPSFLQPIPFPSPSMSPLPSPLLHPIPSPLPPQSANATVPLWRKPLSFPTPLSLPLSLSPLPPLSPLAFSSPSPLPSFLHSPSPSPLPSQPSPLLSSLHFSLPFPLSPSQPFPSPSPSLPTFFLYNSPHPPPIPCFADRLSRTPALLCTLTSRNVCGRQRAEAWVTRPFAVARISIPISVYLAQNRAWPPRRFNRTDVNKGTGACRLSARPKYSAIGSADERPAAAPSRAAGVAAPRAFGRGGHGSAAAFGNRSRQPLLPHRYPRQVAPSGSLRRRFGCPRMWVGISKAAAAAIYYISICQDLLEYMGGGPSRDVTGGGW
ncbi:hypothetical protein C7M84_005990 [Penaeus vannamei]|uniref:Uncharacterized protein n=1 Tax=Penaeus vannamei TaxID=6689 RepID=A0A3R7QRF3_PENVA|nr:hypothetical protein C7M84_005990 [Penaeus vannamei]